MNKTHLTTITAALVAGAALFITGCKTDAPPGRHAMVELSPASGSNVRGMVHFYETTKGIHIVATVTGLAPGLQASTFTKRATAPRRTRPRRAATSIPAA